MTIITRRKVLSTAAAAVATLGVGRVAWAQGGPLRVGLILPISGIGADAAAAWLGGVRVAVQQWNAMGGLLGRPIELVVRDDKFTSAGAVSAARELAGDGVNLMIGGSQSPMALATAPILPELKAVMVAPCPTAMSLTHEGFQKNFFRLSWNAYIAFAGIGNLLTTKFAEVQDWSLIVPDSENGRDMAHFFAKCIERVAARSGKPSKVLDPVYASLNKPDYKIEINGLMNSQADGLFIGLTAAPCISLLQQGRAVGMDRKFKVIGEAGTELLIAKAMQKSTPKNLWGVTFWAPELEPFKSEFAQSKKLMQGIVAVSGDTHPPGIVQATNRSALAIFNAVKKAGSIDSDAVIAALEGLQFDTAAGPYQLRKEDHQGIGSAWFAKIGARDAAPGYGLEDVIRLNEADVVEPPAPGKKFEG